MALHENVCVNIRTLLLCPDKARPVCCAAGVLPCTLQGLEGRHRSLQLQAQPCKQSWP
jgi:hypothetical protein